MVRMISNCIAWLLLLQAAAASPVLNKRDSTCSNLGLVAYWGQNTAGIVNPSDQSKWELPLASYCQDNTYDTLILAFLNIFPSDTRSPAVNGFQPPTLNLAYHCETQFSDQYPFLLSCPQVGADIQTCQLKGKKILLSIGGATGPYGFQSDAQAVQFAKTYWNMFLAGSDPTYPRPFGNNVILDGVDLDIEAGSSVGYAAFVTALRQLAGSSVIVSGAPQCVFPDAYLSTALQTSTFDMITVQFYNNYCSVSDGASFNLDTWIQFARTGSANSNLKIFIGVPAAQQDAGSGYVPASQLNTLLQNAYNRYGTTNFGGVMLWEASLANQNMVLDQSFAQSVKSKLISLAGNGNCPYSPPSPPSPPAPPTAPGSPCQIVTVYVTVTPSQPAPPQLTNTPIMTSVLSLSQVTKAPMVTSVTSTHQFTKAPMMTSVTSTHQFTKVPMVTSVPSPPPSPPTSPPPPSPPASGCPNGPKTGYPCSNGALNACSTQTSYALCLSGKWLQMPCAPGTVCRDSPTGAYCDFASASDPQCPA